MLIGFDISGTKIEICVLDKSGNTLFKHRTPTPHEYELFLSTLCQLVAMAESETQTHCQIGIGLPGAISPATGLIKNANCTFLNGRDLKADLCARLQRNVVIANDANCFALSEAVDGAAKDGNVVFGAILGTGCGGGIVINKQVLVGANAVCGEWGHNPLPSFTSERDGPTRHCYCGRDNCIELFISGSGLTKSAQLIGQQEWNAAEIITRYQQQDPQATKLYQQLIDQMARSFACIVNVLDPDVIVLGGGLSNVASLYVDLPRATANYVFSDSAQIVFTQAKYGDSSGIRGAAWLGLN
ncbi:fructokinase [Vibrio anguillarum]|uniref:ROK family protein n=1 Tax=Vibrio anguillarum TaxID=55601 RepID=A0A289GCF2_VIBAN|nr:MULTISPECIES: ROK family protein [Vibrio]ASW81144.1 transcriptional regulator [Vibrio anguillarum]AXN04935.1 fructokinase [Vibrio anguillarum]AZS23718.1 ROK family protein [Vibrio anguillarum]MBF4311523.1 fructokinase [Vibrio anguillarum]MBF4326753.1 fructokinase [Vibrio anguillarum]